MKHILVYGASLFLAGLLPRLQNLADTKVHHRESLKDLGDLSAYDVVLIDLNDMRAADVLTLLRARPDLRVVGVNADTSAVTVLSGQVYLAQSVTEVLACLDETRPASQHSDEARDE
ncbi:MAG: hypothetical protein ACP5GX_04190 [Anaerolineae bacterium]